jgi:hypothetical protein
MTTRRPSCLKIVGTVASYQNPIAWEIDIPFALSWILPETVKEGLSEVSPFVGPTRFATVAREDRYFAPQAMVG